MNAIVKGTDKGLEVVGMEWLKNDGMDEVVEGYVFDNKE